MHSRESGVKRWGQKWSPVSPMQDVDALILGYIFPPDLILISKIGIQYFFFGLRNRRIKKISKIFGQMVMFRIT